VALPHQSLQSVDSPVEARISEFKNVRSQQALNGLILRGQRVRRSVEPLTHPLPGYVCAIWTEVRCSAGAPVQEDHEVYVCALGTRYVGHGAGGQLDRRFAGRSRCNIEPLYLGKQLCRRGPETDVIAVAGSDSSVAAAILEVEPVIADVGPAGSCACVGQS
jgi:hypothetical protein